MILQCLLNTWPSVAVGQESSALRGQPHALTGGRSCGQLQLRLLPLLVASWCRSSEGLLQGVLAEVGLVAGTVCRLAVLPLAHSTRVSSWKPGAQVTSGQNEVKKTLDDLY